MEEKEVAKPSPTKWAKTACRATAPVLIAATEEEGATPKDTPLSALTHYTSFQLVIPAGECPSVTAFGIPENLIPSVRIFLKERRSTCVAGRVVDPKVKH